jgi:hypothetical protein
VFRFYHDILLEVLLAKIEIKKSVTQPDATTKIEGKVSGHQIWHFSLRLIAKFPDCIYSVDLKWFQKSLVYEGISKEFVMVKKHLCDRGESLLSDGDSFRINKPLKPSDEGNCKSSCGE